MNAVIERFLRYVQYDTTSSEESTTHPSTPSQLAFAQVLAEELSQKQVVIATEVGGGIVPATAEERAAREAAGRLSCLLAKKADTVIRVFCGIPTVLKGEEIR